MHRRTYRRTHRRLLPALLAVLVLAGCAAEPTPTPSAEPEGIAKPSVDARPPAEACVAEADSAGLWVEAGGAWFEAGTIGAGDTVAILVPQSQSNYCGWMDYAAVLSASGIQSLLLNPCGQGLTACDPLADGVTAAAEAVLAAAAQARESGASRVVAVGASMGGTIALRAAELCADDCGIDGAASLAGPLEYGGVDTLDDAGLITVPLFLAVAPGDDVVTAGQLAGISGAAQSESTTITEGSGHGWVLLFDRQKQQTPIATALTGFILG
jgi:hypothetical protein